MCYLSNLFVKCHNLILLHRKVFFTGFTFQHVAQINLIDLSTKKIIYFFVSKGTTTLIISFICILIFFLVMISCWLL